MNNGFQSELTLVPSMVKRARLKGINSIDELAEKLELHPIQAELAITENVLELTLSTELIWWIQVRLLLGFSHQQVIDMLIREENKVRIAAIRRRTEYDAAVTSKKPRKRRRTTDSRPRLPSSSPKASQSHICLVPPNPTSGF